MEVVETVGFAVEAWVVEIVRGVVKSIPTWFVPVGLVFSVVFPMVVAMIGFVVPIIELGFTELGFTEVVFVGLLVGLTLVVMVVVKGFGVVLTGIWNEKANLAST